MSPKFRRSLGLAVLSISLAVYFWGAWPLGKRTRTVPVLIQEIKAPPAASKGLAQEERKMDLAWPDTVRVGDTGTIRFELEAAGSGSGSEAGSGGEPVGQGLVQARLDMASTTVVPPGEVSEPLRPGRPALFYWSVQPKKSGLYPGTLWIYTRPNPGQAGNGDLAQNRQVLSAQRIEFRAISFFGLGGTQARILGFTGALLGLLVTLETTLTGFWKGSSQGTS